MTPQTPMFVKLLLLAGLLTGVNPDVSIDSATVERWAKSFGKNLYQLSLNYSGADFIRGEYSKRNDLQVQRVNGIKMVEEMATKMENMLAKKVSAVENLRNTVEEAHKKHDYNPNTRFEYFNSNLINTKISGTDDPDAHLRKDFELEPSEHFNNIAVNINKSTVQVPANVYNFGPDVLNGIEETELLNEVFQTNYEADPTLTWQYFGHNTGFFRNYPGIKWDTDSNGLDLYDCRKRGWYISSATSPKDIVILIDTSGSMTGSRFEVAKHTINTIMGTLGDDDFFNVISFSDSTQFIQPCFNGTLVQANSDNKNLIKQGLAQMPAPRNIANFQEALIQAFELLKSFNRTGMGASCNQAIMLVTDGAHENYKEIFDKYNKDHHVRVFTYLIGADIGNDPNVLWMSCNNKGYYTRIGAFADVEENAVEKEAKEHNYKCFDWENLTLLDVPNYISVGKTVTQYAKYLHVLSRPMVIEQHHITVWTNVYMDTLVNEGLQLMTTVSQPVFNRKESKRKQGILLGVAGVDVPVKELLKLTPAYKLGVNGYPFAITNNGYILYHPDLRPKDERGMLKPNYNSVDLAEVELFDVDEQDLDRTPLDLDQKKLRTAMVNRQTGYMNMTVRVHSKDMKRLHFRQNHYYYTDLDKTPFSLGIVLSGEAGHNQLMGFETFATSGDGSGGAVGDASLLKQGLENLFGDNETESTILANWIYCQLNNTEAMTLTRLQALQKYLLMAAENGGQLSEKCDPELINHVIFDADVTQGLRRYWEETYSASALASVTLSFIGTKGGLTRIFHNPHASKRSNFVHESPNTIVEEYYQRAVEIPTDKFVYSFPLQNDEDDLASDGIDHVVTASTAVLVRRNGRNSIAAGVGLQFLPNFFRDLLMETTLMIRDDCYADAYDCDLTCYNESVDCYLLDEHGYIVISKEQSEMGTHFAFLREHSRVLDALVDQGVYARVKQVDYQAVCEEVVNTPNAASHLLDPLLTLSTFLMGFTKQLLLLLSHLGIYYSWETTYTEAKSNDEVIYAPCDKEMTYYTANSDRLPKTGYIQKQCDDCKKAYSMQAVPHSNLMFLVIDRDCSCDSLTPTDLTPTRVVYNSSMWCQRLRTRVHRSRPEHCYSQHRLENSTECGRSSWLRPSLPWILLLLLVKFILTWTLTS